MAQLGTHVSHNLEATVKILEGQIDALRAASVADPGNSAYYLQQIIPVKVKKRKIEAQVKGITLPIAHCCLPFYLLLVACCIYVLPLAHQRAGQGPPLRLSDRLLALHFRAPKPHPGRVLPDCVPPHDELHCDDPDLLLVLHCGDGSAQPEHPRQDFAPKRVELCEFSLLPRGVPQDHRPKLPGGIV